MPGSGKNTRLVDPVALFAAPAAPAGQEPLVTAPESSGQRACPAGHPSAPGARFCAQCGAQLPLEAPEPWACANGHACRARDKFCPECGVRRPVAGLPALPPASSYRPKPDKELSAAERAERERRHKEALRLGRADAPVTYEASRTPEDQRVLIHFVEDGLTFAGQVWFRAQEIEIGPDDPRWDQAVQWIFLTDSEQIERWGKVKFRHGPWPGRKSYADALGAFERLGDGQGGTFAGPSEEQLRAADAAEQRRARRLPALPG